MKFIKNTLKSLLGLCSLLALAGIFPGNVLAQVLDEISLHSDKDNIVITIRLSGPVNYKRHFPVSNGRTLDIYYDILDPLHTNPKTKGTADDPWQDGEFRNPPPSNLIPGFTVETEDQQTDNPEVVIKFSHDAEYSVRPGDDGRSFLIYVRKVHPGEEGMLELPEVAPAATADQKPAETLMMDGRNALQTGDYAAAIDDFNKLLQLPSSAYTQDAQEWIGVAREHAGQTDRARSEYESYLKLYSSGAGVARVKGRLANLAPPTKAVAAVPVKEKKAAQTSVYGNLSMNYSRSSTTQIDSSYLLTNLDVSERYRSDDYDNRIVFRDSFSKNYLSKPSKNKLTAAYFDMKNKVADFSARIGRQSATGGGVVGRFDGATVGHGFSPTWRLNAVAGQLSDSTLSSKPVFYGLKLDVGGGMGTGWNGSLFAINQKMASITDRRAAGMELRYFDASKNAFALLDYDTSYHVMNTVLLQGTVNGEAGTTYNFLVDHRRSVMTENAFAGATTTSLNDLTNSGLTETDIRKLAMDRTPITNLAQVGFTRALNEKWQAGADLKVQNTSSIPASGRPSVPGPICPVGATLLSGLCTYPEGQAAITPGTGNIWSLTGQVIASNIISSQDTTVLSLGRITSQLSSAITFSASNRSVLHEKWTIDTSWRLYWDSPKTGVKTTRSQPTIKVTYLVKDRVNLEAETGIETATAAPKRKFFSLGFRWDF